MRKKKILYILVLLEGCIFYGLIALALPVFGATDSGEEEIKPLESFSIGDDFYKDETITATWEVLEGPAMEVYLTDKQNLDKLLEGSEFEYIDREQDTKEGSMEYVVKEDAELYFSFINIANETIKFSYTLELIGAGPNPLILIIITIIIIAGVASGVIGLVFGLKYKKKKRLEQSGIKRIGPMPMSGPAPIYPPMQSPMAATISAPAKSQVKVPKQSLKVKPCPYCKAPTPEGSTFCGNCGADIKKEDR